MKDGELDFDLQLCKCGHIRNSHDEEPPYGCCIGGVGHVTISGVEVEQEWDCDCESFDIAEVR